MTPFPWLPQPGWDESSWAGAHWNVVLESPHLAYICGLRSFDFWLMASSSYTKAGLFWRLRAFLLHSGLAPVTTAGAAFRRRSLSPARTGDREEMSTAHSMGTPSSYRPFQQLLSKKILTSSYFLDVHPTLIYDSCDVPKTERISWRATVVWGLDQVPLLWYIPPLQTHSSLFFLQCIAGLTIGFNFRSSSLLDNGPTSLKSDRSRQFSHRVLTHTQRGLSLVAFHVTASHTNGDLSILSLCRPLQVPFGCTLS